jgi:hypothetical protein
MVMEVALIEEAGQKAHRNSCVIFTIAWNLKTFPKRKA